MDSYSFAIYKQFKKTFYSFWNWYNRFNYGVTRALRSGNSIGFVVWRLNNIDGAVTVVIVDDGVVVIKIRTHNILKRLSVLSPSFFKDLVCVVKEAINDND